MVFKFGLGVVHFLASLGESIVDRVALFPDVIRSIMKNVVNQRTKVDGRSPFALSTHNIVVGKLRPSLWC